MLRADRAGKIMRVNDLFWQISGYAHAGLPGAEDERPRRGIIRRMSSTAAANAAAILAIVAKVPRGRVTTYGSVAARAGLPGRARLVGKLLGAMPANSKVPWHRVVAAQGRIALPASSPSRQSQIDRLQREGVLVVRGRVDMQRYGWSSAPGDELDRLLWGVGE